MSAWLENRLPSYHYVILALLFFGGLETVFSFRSWGVAIGILLALLVAAVIVLIRVEEGTRFDPSHVVLPIVTAAGLTSFTLFLPASPLLHLYFALSALIFYWLLHYGARSAYPTWNWVISTVIFFINAASIIGWRYHLYIPVVVVLILLFTVAASLLWQSLRRVTTTNSQALLLATTAGLAITEVAWAMQFLPLHYLVQAGIIVIVYYVLFNSVSASLMPAFKRRDLLEYVIVGLVALVLVLSTARWR
jgi:hypothetical protein